MLKNYTILITRNKEACAEMQKLLEQRSANVICMPTIEIVDPVNWNDCDNSIWKLSEYDTVCFTSKNAVEKFIQRLRLIRPEALNILSTRNIYAVGPKTQSAIESMGISVFDVPKNYTAHNLFDLLKEKTEIIGNVLLPKGNLADSSLADNLKSVGLSVDEIIVYNTIMPNPENIHEVKMLLKQNKIDIIVFFSPSSIINFLEMIGVDYIKYLNVAVIGPSTAKVVKEYGITNVIVPQVSTAQGIIKAIEDYRKTQAY